MSPLSLRSWDLGLLDDVADLLARAERHDQVPDRTSRRQLADMLSEPWFRPEDDARVVVADDQIAGWGRVWHEPASEGPERVVVVGTIDPSRRSQGLGSLLLAWQVDRASTILAAGGRPGTITASTYDWQTDAARLYRRHGFSLVRTFEELTHPLDSLPESLPPPDTELVPWDRARDEAARRVRNTAFTDHWGSPLLSPESWVSVLDGPDARLDLSFLAISGGDVIGYVFSENGSGVPAGGGWIASVGVLPSARRRGVASALVAASLSAFAAAGFASVGLRVDSESPTGANRLYRTLGFGPAYRSLTYARSPH